MSANMKNNIKYILNVIKFGSACSFCSGFILGLVPNDINLKINGKDKFNRVRVPLPIIGGFIGLSGFIFSPFLITNYFLNGTFFDKLIDKYNIDIKRYHQYDGSDNKYAYPSKIHIEIVKKD